MYQIQTSVMSSFRMAFLMMAQQASPVVRVHLVAIAIETLPSRIAALPIITP